MVGRVTHARTPANRSRTWTVFAAIGVVVALGSWLAFVPWNPSAPGSTARVAWGFVGAVLAEAAIASGVAYADRAAGQSFVVAAYLATLVLSASWSISSEDPLWVLGVFFVGVGGLGALVTAFAVARLVRTGSTLD
jgi:peptidoglycan/LPS O-acetylase OafA/YrhL